MKYIFVILILINTAFYSNIFSDLSAIVNFFSIKKDYKNNINLMDKLQDKVIKDSFEYEDSKTNVILGDINSEIVIEEFISPSCFGCKIFYKHVFSKLKKNYIDTNKIKYIVVEQYHNAQDFYANVLLRCAKQKGGDKLYLKTKEIIFQKQNLWATNREFKKILTNIASTIGISAEEYEECIKNENISHELLVKNKKISEKYNVIATPTIIINGKIYEDEKEIVSILNKLLKEINKS